MGGNRDSLPLLEECIAFTLCEVTVVKIGIIATQDGPNLAAFYDDVWVKLSSALADIGKEPVNELSSFRDLDAFIKGWSPRAYFLEENYR